MRSQLLVASSVALNAIVCGVIISGLAVFLRDLSGLQTFAALHNLGKLLLHDHSTSVVLLKASHNACLPGEEKK
jgi:hypothetical protein